MEYVEATTLEDAPSNARPKKLSYRLQEADGAERATILALSERQELPRRLGKTGPVGERNKTLSFVFIGRSRYRSQRRSSSNLRIVQPKRKQTDRQTTAQAFPARHTGEDTSTHEDQTSNAARFG